MRIIGAKGYTTSDTMQYRCTEHIDSVALELPIYEGEDFSCTYCGDQWKDGLTSTERYERDNNVRHCDNCLSFQPTFTGTMCPLCVAEAAKPVTVDVDGEKWTQVIRNNTVIRYTAWEFVTGVIAYRDKSWTTAILDTETREVIRVDMSGSQPNTTYTLSGLTWTLMENMGYESDDISSEYDEYDYPEDDSYEYESYAYEMDSDLMNEW